MISRVIKFWFGLGCLILAGCSSSDLELTVRVEYDPDAGFERLRVSGFLDDGTPAFEPGFLPSTPRPLTSGADTALVLLPDALLGQALLVRVDAEREGELAGTGGARVEEVVEGGSASVLIGALVVCGDGQREPGLEGCDDGNTVPDDGCDSSCVIESGFVCTEIGADPSLCFEGELGECANGVDDDGDGAVDFGADDGCSSARDVSERAACSDTIDNDGDGLVDTDDPGCDSANDGAELGTSV